MKYAIVDDEILSIEKLKSEILKVNLNVEIFTFTNSEEFLLFLNNNIIDVAFLDIEMPEINGLELTCKIKEIYPTIGVIFVTGYSKYALEAHGLFVSGFLLKPVTKEKVQEALDYLRPIAPSKTQHIKIKCFGNFDVFINNELLTFPRSKSKELLAYLIHCLGNSVTTAEIAAILWEDKPYNRSLQNQTQKVISVMMQTLRQAGVEEIVIKKPNSICVNPTKFQCDYYEFLKGDKKQYISRYMQCYSWSEIITAGFEKFEFGY